MIVTLYEPIFILFNHVLLQIIRMNRSFFWDFSRVDYYLCKKRCDYNVRFILKVKINRKN